MKSGATSRQLTPTSLPAASHSIAELRVNLANGETKKFTLPQQHAAWRKLETNPEFQAGIRGVSLFHDGRIYSLPSPKAFRRVSYAVELSGGAESVAAENVAPASIRATVAADDVTATLTLYLGANPMSSFSIRRTGRQRWSPDR